MAKDKTIEGYIAGLADDKRAIVARLVEIVRKNAPAAAGSIKWAQPVFEQAGPFAHIKAFKGHVNFGFWRGVDLDDPKGLLSGDGKKMRHVRIASMEDIDADAFAAFVRQAVELNTEKGDPTKG